MTYDEFQLTRSRGAWRFDDTYVTTNDQFQLTRSRGAWLTIIWQHFRNMRFQLTRSRGAWLKTIGGEAFANSFQLTRSRGAWLSQRYNFQAASHFNSHAHVERDTWCCVYLVLAPRDADLFFYLLGIGLIPFTICSQRAWHFHANLAGIRDHLGYAGQNIRTPSGS